MGKVNGTDLLVYCDGTLIATQKTCTVTWEQDLYDTTNKSSGGWEEHENGMRRCTCDFDALYSTTGLSAEELITYITGRTSLVLLIDGGGYPIVGEARPKNANINTPMEDAVSVSGSFTFDGPAWMLTGAYANLMTDPEGTNQAGWDVCTIVGIAITVAHNAAGAATIDSNAFTATATKVYKLITFCTNNSLELPTLGIYDPGVGYISNEAQVVEGVNILTLTATDTQADAHLRIEVTGGTDADFALTNIYLFLT